MDWALLDWNEEALDFYDDWTVIRLDGDALDELTESITRPSIKRNQGVY